MWDPGIDPGWMRLPADQTWWIHTGHEMDSNEHDLVLLAEQHSYLVQSTVKIEEIPKTETKFLGFYKDYPGCLGFPQLPPWYEQQSDFLEWLSFDPYPLGSGVDCDVELEVVIDWDGVTGLVTVCAAPTSKPL